MTKLLLYIALNLICKTAFAQNLVPNGSFEDLKVSPHELYQEYYVAEFLMQINNK